MNITKLWFNYLWFYSILYEAWEAIRENLCSEQSLWLVHQLKLDERNQRTRKVWDYPGANEHI